MRVAFIGTGAMGEPMAANLLVKRFDLTVVRHRRSEAVERLQALGAAVATRVTDAVAGRDVVVLCLPASRDVEAVVTGEAGIADAARPGTLVLDCGTSDPASTRRLGAVLALRDIAFVDAGMTRGVAGAKQGKLAFFLGGDAAHIERAMPVLKALGDTFVHVGPLGDGHAAKLISNVLSYGTVALLNEAYMLGARAGLDLQRLHEALEHGAPSKALESFGGRIVAGEYQPARVTVEHVCEDMAMLQSFAASHVAPVFMLSAAQEIYRLLLLRGEGARDMSVIAELWRSGAGGSN